MDKKLEATDCQNQLRTMDYQLSTTKRISLWSGPRNISTALMYSFAQRTDTQVFDEPLYGFYLSHSNADEYHPGAEDIIHTMENDGDKVMQMLSNISESPVYFFKNMTHHLLDLDRNYLQNFINVILTRDPIEMLPSYSKVVKQPSMQDVGYQLHIDLIRDLRAMNLPVIVIDSKSILLNPEEQLRKLCEAIDIPFQSEMLRWEKGARPEDGIWAKYWYDNIHNSTSFKPYTPKTTAFPEHLKPLLKECEVCYRELLKLAL